MNDKPQINLTRTEIMQGALIGTMRNLQDIRDKKTHRYGATNALGWQMDIDGALGEFALAKYLNLYYAGVGVMGGGDVGDHQARHTQYHRGRLIIHPTDFDDKKYWLVTGIDNPYTIHGWLMGADGKKDKWWCDPTGKNRHAFFVPQDQLIKP